jgi:Spy/CpxP family protein refolding chaperone
MIMKFLKNTFFVGLTALSLATSAGAFAQQANSGSTPTPERAKKMEQMQQRMQQQMQAGMEKHRMQLHDKLKLTAQQEPAWKAFTDATSPQHAGMHDAKGDHQAMANLSAPAMVEKMLERSKERMARQQQHLDALKTFYAVLTPEQQKILDDSHRRMHNGMKMRMHEGMQNRMQKRMQHNIHEGPMAAPNTK